MSNGNFSDAPIYNWPWCLINTPNLAMNTDLGNKEASNFTLCFQPTASSSDSGYLYMSYKVTTPSNNAKTSDTSNYIAYAKLDIEENIGETVVSNRIPATLKWYHKVDGARNSKIMNLHDDSGSIVVYTNTGGIGTARMRKILNTTGNSVGEAQFSDVNNYSREFGLNIYYPTTGVKRYNVAFNSTLGNNDNTRIYSVLDTDITSNRAYTPGEASFTIVDTDIEWVQNGLSIYPLYSQTDDSMIISYKTTDHNIKLIKRLKENGNANSYVSTRNIFESRYQFHQQQQVQMLQT